MGKRDLRDCIVRAAFATLIAALIGLVDPMGLDEATDRHSADVVQRMAAPFYRGAQDRIAVIEITDHALNQNDIPWPPPRFVYSWLLDKLTGPGELPPDAAAARPAVIFFDYAFISQADNADQLAFIEAVRKVTGYVGPDGTAGWGGERDCHRSAQAKLRCIHRAGGVPIVIGKNYPPNACLTGEARKQTAEDVALAHAAVVVPLGWPDLPTRFQALFTREGYVSALAGGGVRNPEDCASLNPAPEPALTPTAQVAPDWAPLGFKAGDRDFGYDLSPALAMADALCLRGGGRKELCGPLQSAVDRGVAPLRFKTENPVGPEWGSVSDPASRDVFKAIYGEGAAATMTDCQERASLGWAARVGWAQLTSGLGEGAAATAVKCPFHLTLDVDVFFDLPTETLASLRRRLKDRAVAIGAAQSLTNDWISTTLNARQPGVHYHAMTLDNLLVRGPDLLEEPGAVIPWIPALRKFDWGDVLELVCLFFIALMVEDLRKRFEGQEDRGYWRQRRSLQTFWRHRRKDARHYWRTAQGQRHRARWVAALLLAAALILVLAAALTVLLRWAPVNLVGLAGFTLLFVAFELWTHDGWGGVVGLLAAILILAPARLARWFGRPELEAAKARRSRRRAGRATSPSPPVRIEEAKS